MASEAPGTWAATMERRRNLPRGGLERQTGYGVMGLPFAFGDVLAFRRTTASSIGPPYSSVWHRDPGGSWTLYSDIDLSRSCARYFATMTAAGGNVRRVEAAIGIEWLDPFRVAVSIPAHHLEWTVRMETSPATSTFNIIARLVPWWLVHDRPFVRYLATSGIRILRAGPLRLHGRTPTGHLYTLSPVRVWGATAAAAMVKGRDLGPTAAGGPTARLGEFTLPHRGLFAVSHWSFAQSTDTSPY